VKVDVLLAQDRLPKLSSNIEKNIDVNKSRALSPGLFTDET